MGICTPGSNDSPGTTVDRGHKTVNFNTLIAEARNVVRVHVIAETTTNGFAPLGEIFVRYLSQFDRHGSC